MVMFYLIKDPIFHSPFTPQNKNVTRKKSFFVAVLKPTCYHHGNVIWYVAICLSSLLSKLTMLTILTG